MSKRRTAILPASARLELSGSGNGEIKEQLSLLVNPEQPFTARNMSIHGINGDMTRNSATIPGLEPELRRLL